MATGERCARPLDFPRRPDNRPALPRIGYRIGGYSDFRESIMRRLDATPQLAHWTHREPDDPGIALLECAAVLGDILTFYQELYANEAYLRTASWRTSVAELVRLLGYRLAPGLGGRGTFALLLRPGGPVSVPAGLSLLVELEGATEPVVLETSSEAVAHPELGSFALHRPLSLPALAKGADELWIRSDPPVELAADDRLLVATRSGDRLLHPQIVVVDDLDVLHGATIARIKGSLRRAYAPGAVAFRVGRSFRHFGHSAPPDHVRIVGDTAQSTAVSYCRNLATTTQLGSGPLTALDLPLATAVDDLAAGIDVICTYAGGCAVPSPAASDWDVQHAQFVALAATGPAGASVQATLVSEAADPASVGVAEGLVASSAPTRTVLRTVAGARAVSLQVGALTGAATVLTLEQGLSSGGITTADIRTVEVHEVTSAMLHVAARPVDKPVAAGRDLLFRGSAEAAAELEGRRLLLHAPGAAPLSTVATAVALEASGVPGLGGLHRVTLAAEVDYAGFPQGAEAPSATIVYGNVVDADQGESSGEAIVGSGDGRRAFQTFQLPRSPLTYHHRAGQSPPQVPEVELRVAGRLWTRVDSLYEQGPDAEVYVVRGDAAGDSWVQFGDGGRFGARLPSGPDNVRARLRTGVGAYGPPKPGTRIQPGRLERLDRVVLPGQISGGDEAETAEVARAAAPGRIQSLDRLVSLDDYESEALALPGVVLASAAWGLLDGVPAVIVTVLMEGGREQEHAAVAGSLRAAARERGPDRFEIEVRQGRFRDVLLHAEVALAAGHEEARVLADIGAALGVQRPGARPPTSGLFSLAERRFGAAEQRSRVTGRLQNVAGVAWTRVAVLGALPEAGRAAAAAPAWAAAPRVACPPDRVLRLVDDPSAKTFSLTTVAGPPAGAPTIAAGVT